MNPAPAANVAGESGMDESLRIITVMSPENVMVFVASEEGQREQAFDQDRTGPHDLPQGWADAVRHATSIEWLLSIRPLSYRRAELVCRCNVRCVLVPNNSPAAVVSAATRNVAM